MGTVMLSGFVFSFSMEGRRVPMAHLYEAAFVK